MHSHAGNLHALRHMWGPHILFYFNFYYYSTSLVKQSMKGVNYSDLRIGVSNKQLEVN